MIETEKKRLYNIEPIHNEVMQNQDIWMMDTNVLAYVGDAVYEVYIRKRFISENPKQRAGNLHKLSVRYVKSEAQAAAIRGLESYLCDEEKEIVRRARNKKSISRPKNAEPLEYKMATAFEALIGYLFLKEDTGRAEEIMNIAVRLIGEADV